MRIVTETIELDTKGNPDLLNITRQLPDVLKQTKLIRGNFTVFVIGSTAAITTFEYEPGLIQDVRELFERLAPLNKKYHHDETWQDNNGASHLRASLQGPSLVIPFEDGKLVLGTWQQVVLAEFDTRPRRRQIVVQLIGE